MGTPTGTDPFPCSGSGGLAPTRCRMHGWPSHWNCSLLALCSSHRYLFLASDALSPLSAVRMPRVSVPFLRFSPSPAVISHMAILSSLAQLLVASAGHCLLRSRFPSTPLYPSMPRALPCTVLCTWLVLIFSRPGGIAHKTIVGALQTHVMTCGRIV